MIPALVARNWDVWCVGIVAVALGYAGFARKDRWPTEAWAVGAVLIALPLCSSVLPSFNRFVLADFVIYPAYAAIYGRLPRWAKMVLTPLVVVALLITSWMMIERFTRDPFPRFVRVSRARAPGRSGDGIPFPGSDERPRAWRVLAGPRARVGLPRYQSWSV